MMLHSRISSIIRSSSSHRPEQAATVSQGVATGMVYSHDSQAGVYSYVYGLITRQTVRGVWLRALSTHKIVRGVATGMVYSHDRQGCVATCMVYSHDSKGCGHGHGLFTRQSVRGVWLRAWSIHTTVSQGCVATCMV